MRLLPFLLSICLLCAPAALGEILNPDQIPEACYQDADGEIDYEACFAVSEPNSVLWLLAAINLGSEAFWSDDVSKAAYYYDLSSPPDLKTYSDIILHANRASVFRRVGRLDDSLVDAAKAFELLRENKFDDFGTPLDEDAKGYVLALVVQTFFDAGADELEETLAMFLGLTGGVYSDDATKAAILIGVERYDEALVLSERLVVNAPEDTMILNNHCYMLTNIGRAADGLVFCQKAVELDPQHASFLHSLAVTYAALGQCETALEAFEKGRAREPSLAAFQEPLSCVAE